MKLSAILLSILILFTPGIALARHRRGPPPTPTPIPTPPPPVTSGKIYGVNYGHNFASSGYNAAQASADLDELKAAHVNAIRIYLPTYNNPTEVSWTKQLALLARSKGFIVTWGVCTGGAVTNITQWNNFIASLDSQAMWANGVIDFFEIGNEEELANTGLNQTGVENSIRIAAAHIKSLYPNLKLTYATAADPDLISAWSNTGVLDTVGFNLYVAFQDLTNQIKQNPRAIITEWNTDGGLYASGINGNQSAWAITLVKDRDIINASGLKAYLFVVRGNGGGIDDSWSMWVGSTRRQAWQSLIN